ncbi:hypothetical protein AB0K51_19160 [Kitasatospora sp. NPDC049285]|uniref:hypothetical protein n=1 Tax=Streptomycetaceae TaxID=2062 RepID=UPI0004BE6B79|nr:hypothetical protein [Streptomyces sp. NRRL S-350]
MWNIPATGLTMGGLLTGLAIPVIYLSRFGATHVKNRKAALRNSTELVPVVLGMAYGTFTTATTAGLIGAFTGIVTWLGNGAGSLAMWGLVGGHTTLNVRSNPLELDGAGGLVLLLVSIAIIAAWKPVPEQAKKRMKWGVVSGILLGLSATLGGAVAATIIPAANSAGAAIVGAIN